MKNIRKLLKSSDGFTLMEMVIVIGLFGLLMTSLLGTLVIIYRNTNRMEYVVSYKTQEERILNFIRNVVRQNQVEGAIELYGDVADGASRLRIKLSKEDDPNTPNVQEDKYLHIFAQDNYLYMYVSGELDAGDLIDENNAMVIARDIKEIRFVITNDSSNTRTLDMRWIVGRSIYNSVTGTYEDKNMNCEGTINIYTR